MSNLLTKDAPRVIIVRPEIPAVAPTSPIPAWDETIYVTTYERGPIIAWIGNTGYIHVGSVEPPLPFVPPLGSGSGNVTEWRPVYGRSTPIVSLVPTIIHHPAIPGTAGSPAVPAETVVLDNVGWNAGAISIETIAADGLYEFSVDASAAGVVTGFNSNDTGAGYVEIQHGLLCASGKVFVMERGVIVNGPSLYATGDVFLIARIGGRVKYFHNGGLLYSSTTPSRGTVFADASLYVGGDDIIDASIVHLTIAGGVATGDDSNDYTAIVSAFSAGSGSSGSGAFDPLRPGSNQGSFALGGTIGPFRGGGSDAAYASAYGVIQFGIPRDEAPNASTVGVTGTGDATTGAILGGSSIGRSLGIGGGAPVPGAAGSIGGSSGVPSVGPGSASGTGNGAGVGGDFVVRNGSGAGTLDPERDGGNPIVGTDFDGGGIIGPFRGGGSNFAYAWATGYGTIKLVGMGVGSSLGVGGVQQSPGIGGVGGPVGGVGGPTTLDSEGTGLGRITVTGVGYGYDALTTQYAIGGGSFTLEGYGEANLITPQYAIAHGVLTPPVGYGRESDLSAVNEGSGGGDIRLTGFAANFFYAEARGEITGFDGYGTQAALSTLDAELPIAFELIGIGRVGDARDTNMVLPVLQAVGYAGGVANNALPLLRITASGKTTTIGRLDASLPALTFVGSGTVPSVGRLDVTLPQGLALLGAGGGYASMRLPVLSLLATGAAPSVARLDAQLPSGITLQGFAGGGANVRLPVPTITATGTAVVLGRMVATLPGAPTLSARGGAALESRLSALTFVGSGSSPRVGRMDAQLPSGLALTAYGGAALDASLPFPSFTGNGAAPSVARMDALLPDGLTLKSYGGGSATNKLPSIHFTGSGSAPIVGRMDVLLPSGLALTAFGGGAASNALPVVRITASGTAPIVGRMNATLPVLSLRGYGGGYAAVNLPSLGLTASGRAAIVARLDAVLPALTFEGSVTMPVLGRLDAVLPAFHMAMSATMAVAFMPALTIEASGTVGGAAATHEAYSITLFVDGTVAVTRIDTFPFDRIVRWRDKYYGIASNGVYELGGDTFDGAPIVANIKTAKTDLEIMELKRAPDLFLNGIVPDDMATTLYADDVAHAMSEPILRDRVARTRAGKGVKGHYLAYGMTNRAGGDFSIEAISPLIEVLRRRQ